MNPLDHTGQEFMLSLANPNPKARRRKDGPRYFVEFEIDSETFENLMGCRELAGMVIECRAEVAALNEPIAESAPAQPAPEKRATNVATERLATTVVASAPARVQSLAQRLHIDGYFRNPRLWNVLHQRGVYTLQEHKKWIESQPCLATQMRQRVQMPRGEMIFDYPKPLMQGTFLELACSGEVCLHHVNSAAIAPGGREQLEAPRKVPHFYGVPLCMNGHHSGWVHTKYATREDKEGLLEIAVALTAHRVKEAIKIYLDLESLSAITENMLATFEADLGLKAA